MRELEIYLGVRQVQSEWYKMTPYIKRNICEGE